MATKGDALMHHHKGGWRLLQRLLHHWCTTIAAFVASI
jgi:hypothetical protein